MKTKEQLKNKIVELHLRENELNIENGQCDRQIDTLLKKKKKLAKKISNNVKYRNTLINELHIISK